MMVYLILRLAISLVVLLQWMLNRKKGGGGSQEPQEAQPAV